LDAFARGSISQAFANVCVAPISLNWATEAIVEIMLSNNAERTFHLTSLDEASYVDLAGQLAEATGSNRRHVIGIEAEFDPLRGAIPGPHAALGDPYSTETCPAPKIGDAIAQVIKRLPKPN
jgi:dTDP-4-dehydrorhamnose reductase